MVRKYPTVTIDKEHYKKLQKIQEELKQEFGFEPSLKEIVEESIERTEMKYRTNVDSIAARSEKWKDENYDFEQENKEDSVGAGEQE